MASPTNGLGADPHEMLRTISAAIEAETAAAMERLVGSEGFSELLVRITENAVAVSRIWADGWDLMLRSVRLPVRGDVDRLARQLRRNEDKLELILQAVEQLEPLSRADD